MNRIKSKMIDRDRTRWKKRQQDSHNPEISGSSPIAATNPDWVDCDSAAAFRKPRAVLHRRQILSFPYLSEISVYNFYQLFSSLGALSRFLSIRVAHVGSYVFFDYLCHQSVNCSTACGNQLKSRVALLLFFERLLNGINLTSNSPRPVE